MKVFNLACEQDHRFEGWFGTQDDFDSQSAHGQVHCPMCGNSTVHKLPSAPHLNLSHARDDVANRTDPVLMQQARMLEMARALVKDAENVGERFPDEARRIHYGESADRSIRGTASREEREALLQEGIEVMPLPFAHLFNDRLQ